MEDTLWTEKYRPTIIDDLIADNTIKQKLSLFIETRNVHNLIIIGSHGHGKTCIINILGQMLFHNPTKSVLRLDAYDYRGNRTIHEIVNSFCRVRCTEGFKIVVFDDIDNIDDKMQTQLITLMDRYERNIKFIFISNTSENIIESIQSRCLLLRIGKPERIGIVRRLKHILECEGLEYEDEAIDLVHSLSDGDIRQAINIIQLIGIKFKSLTVDNLNLFYDMPQREVIENIYRHIMNKDVETSLELVISLLNVGYSNTDIAGSMFYYLRTSEVVPENTKMMMMNKLAKTTYTLSTEIDSRLQLYACIASMCT